MFQFTIPANGSSVPVGDFAAEAEKVYDGWLEGEGKGASEEQQDQVKAAIDAAGVLIAGGHGGTNNVYVTLSGNATEGHALPAPGALESLVAVAVYQRPSPVAVAAAEGESPAPAPKARAKKGGA